MVSAITDWCNAFDRAKIILLFGKLMGFLTQFMVEMGQISIRLPVTQHRPPVKQHREPAQRCKVPFQIEEVAAFEEDEPQDFDHVAQRTDTA